TGLLVQLAKEPLDERLALVDPPRRYLRPGVGEGGLVEDEQLSSALDLSGDVREYALAAGRHRGSLPESSVHSRPCPLAPGAARRTRSEPAFASRAEARSRERRPGRRSRFARPSPYSSATSRARPASASNRTRSRSAGSCPGTTTGPRRYSNGT